MHQIFFSIWRNNLMAKTFILDTNVLLHDTNCVNAFADNNVVIPITVIEELDNFKTSEDERGKNARMVSRLLDSLREKGKLNEIGRAHV